MKKEFIQIIGVVILILGLITFFRDLPIFTSIRKETITSLYGISVINGISIYGGWRLINLQEVGRKLGIMWAFYCLSWVVLTKLPGYISGEAPFLAPANRISLILVFSVYAFYGIVFIVLMGKRTKELLSCDENLILKTRKVLSLLAPGLGLALTGNFIIGVFLFLGYLWVMNLLFSQPDFSATIILGLVVWKVFNSIDLAAEKYLFPIHPKIILPEANKHEENRG